VRDSYETGHNLLQTSVVNFHESLSHYTGAEPPKGHSFNCLPEMLEERYVQADPP